MTPTELVVIAGAEHERRATQARRLAWIGAAAIVVLVLAVQPFRNTDVWWNLALGRLIATTGIPAHEPFSFLPAAHAWIGQQWLYQVTLAGLVGAGGAGLASLVMGLVATAAVVIAALSVPSASRISGPWLALAMVITGVVLTAVVGVSSSEITVLGAAIVLFVISRWRAGRAAAVWGLPPLFLLWANMDSGFAAGLLILVAALLFIKPAGGAGRRQLAIALAVSAVAALANPLGPGIYVSVIAGVVSPGAAQNLTGWASPNFHEWSDRLFEAEIILMIVLWTVSGGPDRFSAIVGFTLLIATLFAQENLGILAVFLAPELAVHASRAWSRHGAPRIANRAWGTRRHLHPIATSAVLVVMTTAMAVLLIPQLSPSAAASYQARTYPEAAASYVSSHFPGQRIYTIDTWGGYLAYRFPDSRVVFLYDEPAVFSTSALQQYLAVDQLQPNWIRVLADEHVEHAILPSNAREASAMHVLGWTVDCFDPTSSSMVMSAPPPGSPAPTVGLTIPLPGVPDC
ncbi:MAG: hypothetical protein WCB51_11700 [Candidatus Dormiibacterota bacterium]